jgi:hypothetical protein
MKINLVKSIVFTAIMAASGSRAAPRLPGKTRMLCNHSKILPKKSNAEIQ